MLFSISNRARENKLCKNYFLITREGRTVTVLVIAARYSRTVFLLHSLYTFGNMERAHGGALNPEMSYPTMLLPSRRKTHALTDLQTIVFVMAFPEINYLIPWQASLHEAIFKMVDYFINFWIFPRLCHIWLSVQQPFNITPGGLISWINPYLALRESRACKISVLWHLTPPWLSAAETTGYFVTWSWKHT